MLVASIPHLDQFIHSGYREDTDKSMVAQINATQCTITTI